MCDSVTQYKIYCNTESKFVTGWGTTPPTVCYNNNTHTVNLNSIQVVEIVASNQVTINQQDVSQTSRFIIESIYLDNIAPNSTSVVNHVFDVAISMHSFNFALSSAEDNDLFSVAVNPNTPLGLITADVKSGDTTIPVSVNVLPYIKAGFYLTVTDGTNTEGPTKILSVDSINLNLVLKTALTNDYSATNTQILLSYYVVKDMPIVLGSSYSFGGEIINASIVPAGTVGMFSFTNNGSTTKDVAVYLTGKI
jgi:hypothetical protein